MIRWFMCSTPLHCFTATALAGHLFQGDQNHFCLIDQADIHNNDYFQLIANLKDSPFCSTRIFPGRIRGTLNKLASRRAVAAKIGALIKKAPPEQIFTGNDRRIEFQFAMHKAQKIQPKCEGVYMDEGTFTYIGRPASLSWQDRIVDNTLKKLIYGFWWQNPPTVGASNWITTVYAAYPQQVTEALTTKICKKIESQYFCSGVTKRLAEALLAQFSLDPCAIKQIRLLITPPHESLVTRQPEIKTRILEFIEDCQSQDHSVAIKYHPRDLTDNWLKLHANEVTLLPKCINFESLLPLLHKDCQVVGDLSSTLLTSRWMRPDISVVALKRAGVEQNYQKLLQKLDVRLM